MSIQEGVKVTYFDHQDVYFDCAKLPADKIDRKMLRKERYRDFLMAEVAIYVDLNGERKLLKSRW